MTNHSKKMPHPHRGQRSITIRRVTRDTSVSQDDIVAAEEPLEIRLVFGPENISEQTETPPPKRTRRSKSLAVTMRTPGHDFELAAGFLLSESIIEHGGQIRSFEHAGPPPEAGAPGNTLVVELAPDVKFAAELLQRNFYTTSSCGVCGKASIEAIHAQGLKKLEADFQVDRKVLFELPTSLRQAQEVFDATGGLHAAGLFDKRGDLQLSREDVGRHNAVDKLVGHQLLAFKEDYQPTENLLVVSGRASFELVQKAIAASLSMMVAVGAPSSLAVELAREFNLTLIGFASDRRFNIYSGEQRVS